MESAEPGLEVRRLVKLDGEGSVKAFCDLVIGDRFLVKGLRIMEGKKGMFVSMPRQRGKNQQWYDSVEALTTDVKQRVERLVMEAYRNGS